MYVIIVYETAKDNCVKLHKVLKKHLFWNQNSVFEGSVTDSQLKRIKILLEQQRAPESHITLYSIENEKLLSKEELGVPGGNTLNII